MTTVFALQGVTGEIVTLDGPVFFAGKSPGVFGFAPVEIGSVATPALTAGSLRGKARWGDRPLILPLVVITETTQALWEAVETLGRLLDPTRGDCLIIATRPDGSQREMVCHYSAGLLPNIVSAESTETTVPLIFRCPDPFWTSTGPNTATIDLPVNSTAGALPFDADVDFDAPLPFDGYDANGAGTTIAVIENAGSAEAWPRWTISGPCDGVTAANLTTGRVWSWTVAPYSSLGAGSVLIDTREKSRSVRLSTGENRYRGFQLGTRDLWPLAPRTNRILLQVDGADAQTTVEVSWLHRSNTC